MAVSKSKKVQQRTSATAETPLVKGLVYIFTALSVVFAALAYALYW